MLLNYCLVLILQSYLYWQIFVSMGNSKTKPGIYIELDRSFYLPGDVVVGNVYINAQQAFPTSKIVLNVSGNQNIWWKGTGSSKAQSENINSTSSLHAVNKSKSVPLSGDRIGECKIIEASMSMTKWGNSNSNKLQGQFTFPFEFRLPSYVPGSFKEETPEYKASVVYMVKCIIVADGKVEDATAEREILIREPRKNNQQVLYGETFLYPHTCFCRKNGVSKISCYFEKNQYLPGEECIAICEADNYKCKLRIKDIKVKFKKVVTLTSAFGEERTFQQEINRSSFPGVEAHGQYIGQNAKRISIPLKYRNSSSPVHSTTNGRLVKCHYYLEISPQLSGFYLKNIGSFQVSLNIIHEAQSVVQIQQPDNWNPEVGKKSQIMMGENYSNPMMDQMGTMNYF